MREPPETAFVRASGAPGGPEARVAALLSIPAAAMRSHVWAPSSVGAPTERSVRPSCMSPPGPRLPAPSRFTPLIPSVRVPRQAMSTLASSASGPIQPQPATASHTVELARGWLLGTRTAVRAWGRFATGVAVNSWEVIGNPNDDRMVRVGALVIILSVVLCYSGIVSLLIHKASGLPFSVGRSR